MGSLSQSVPLPTRSGGSGREAAGMYTVAKGPTAILQKTRRGLNKNLENSVEGTKTGEREVISVRRAECKETKEPLRIVFQPVKMRNNQRRRVQQEHLSPEHRELVSFVTEGWVRVKREMDQGSGKVAVYQDTTNPSLEQFEPFDLDAWWGKKLYQNLTSGI